MHSNMACARGMIMHLAALAAVRLIHPPFVFYETSRQGGTVLKCTETEEFSRKRAVFSLERHRVALSGAGTAQGLIAKRPSGLLGAGNAQELAPQGTLGAGTVPQHTP